MGVFRYIPPPNFHTHPLDIFLEICYHSYVEIVHYFRWQ